jgi:hypothetical protein
VEEVGVRATPWMLRFAKNPLRSNDMRQAILFNP